MKKLLFMLMGVAATINAMAVDYTAKANLLLQATSGEDCEMYLRQSNEYGALEGYDMYMANREVALYAINGEKKLQMAKAADLNNVQLGLKTDASTSYTITVSNVAGSETLYLWDWDFKSYALTEGASYTFDAEANATIENRFSIHKVVPVQLKGEMVGTDCGANQNEWCDEALTVSANNETASYSQNITAGWYNFGLYINGVYKNNKAEFSRDNNEQGGFSYDDQNSWMYADIDGEYTFTWNYATEKLTITYPAAPAPTCDYSREGLTVGKYYTICLPKAVENPTGASFWNLRYRNSEGTLAYLEEATGALVAGRPYIFQAEATELCFEYNSGDDVPAGAYGALVGTLTGMNQVALTAAGTDIYLLNNNQLWLVSNQDGNNLPENRAYVKYSELIPGNPQAAPGRRVRAIPMQANGTTGLENLNVSEAPAKMIIDGKMYILRGEQMFDATGRLVK